MAGNSIKANLKTEIHSWQACAWLLERKYPSIFGKSDRLFAQQLQELRQELKLIRAVQDRNNHPI